MVIRDVCIDVMGSLHRTNRKALKVISKIMFGIQFKTYIIDVVWAQCSSLSVQTNVKVSYVFFPSMECKACSYSRTNVGVEDAATKRSAFHHTARVHTTATSIPALGVLGALLPVSK
jgi:hypothetical protein